MHWAAFHAYTVAERNEIVQKLRAGLIERSGEMWGRPVRNMRLCVDLLASLADVEQGAVGLREKFAQVCLFSGRGEYHVQSAIARWRFSTAAKLIAYRPALDPAGHIPLASSSRTREG